MICRQIPSHAPRPGKFCRLCLCAAILLTTQVQALELGDAQIDSALGQPLAVRIPVIKTPSEKLSQDSVVVRVATPSEHARAGLTYPASLADAVIELKRPASRQPYIALTTTDGVVEPLLSLLVELRWAEGRIFKEVALFLDPPALRSAATPAKSGDAKREAMRQAYDSATRIYGPVAAGQTLSEIAVALRPRGVALEELMREIFESNPQAFGTNMDLLHKGAMLSIPEPAEAGDIAEPTTTSPTPAVVEATPAQGAAAEAMPIEEEAASQQSNVSGGRLFVLSDDEQTMPATPESPQVTLPTVADEELEQEIAVLQNRLLDAEQELELERRRNQETQALVANMRDELSATHKRLESAITDYQRLAEESKGPAAPAVVTDTADTSPLDLLKALPPWLVAAAGLLGIGLLSGLLMILMLRRREDRYWERERHEGVAVNDVVDRADTSPEIARPVFDNAADAEPVRDHEAEQGSGPQPVMAEGRAPSITPLDDTELGPPPVTAPPEDDLHAKYEKVSSMTEAGAGGKQIVEYLTTGQYNLADTKVHHEIISADGNDEGKLLLLTFYKAIGKHDELKELAQAILERYPDADDPTRKEVLAICHNVVDLEKKDAPTAPIAGAATVATIVDNPKEKTAVLDDLPPDDGVEADADPEAATAQLDDPKRSSYETFDGENQGLDHRLGDTGIEDGDAEPDHSLSDTGMEAGGRDLDYRLAQTGIDDHDLEPDYKLTGTGHGAGEREPDYRLSNSTEIDHERMSEASDNPDVEHDALRAELDVENLPEGDKTTEYAPVEFELDPLDAEATDDEQQQPGDAETALFVWDDTEYLRKAENDSNDDEDSREK